MERPINTVYDFLSISLFDVTKTLKIIVLYIMVLLSYYMAFQNEVF